jgi:hypothetical protein
LGSRAERGRQRKDAASPEQHADKPERYARKHYEDHHADQV